jgi:hypothetical protein
MCSTHLHQNTDIQAVYGFGRLVLVRRQEALLALFFVVKQLDSARPYGGGRDERKPLLYTKQIYLASTTACMNSAIAPACQRDPRHPSNQPAARERERGVNTKSVHYFLRG